MTANSNRQSQFSNDGRSHLRRRRNLPEQRPLVIQLGGIGVNDMPKTLR